jgi:hypothetical protein
MVRSPAPTLAFVAVALVLAGCTAEPSRPSSAVSPTTSASVTVSPVAATATESTPSPTAPTPTLAPGDLCDPADGSPDCTDATGAGDGQYRYIEGYADCVADLGTAEAHGLCTDLDGDGRAGYPDSG